MKSNKHIQYEKEIEKDKISFIIDGLSQEFIELQEAKVLYLLVCGGHPKSNFKEFKSDDRIEFKWFGYYAPSILKIFSPIIAGYGALIKINDISILNELVVKFTHLSMIELFYFSTTFEDEIIDNVKSKVWKSDPIKLIEYLDNTYFTLLIDGDNAESTTGYYAVVSYGNMCSVNITRNFHEVWNKLS